jgi:hypothetical protein
MTKSPKKTKLILKTRAKLLKSKMIKKKVTMTKRMKKKMRRKDAVIAAKSAASAKTNTCSSWLYSCALSGETSLKSPQ